MKRMIGNILLFILSITVFCCIYVGLFKMSPAMVGLLLVIFALYGACMGAGWKSMEQLKKFERKAVHFGLTRKDESKILLYSLATLCPSYFCVILVSLIPLYTHEIWFITVFPCIMLNCLPASSVLEEYYGLTHSKLSFVVYFLLLTVACCLLGVIGSSLLS